MSQASQQLHALIPRLETFLAKLAGRAREVAAEASAAVAEMRAANDPNTATASYNLQAGITSQIQELTAKGRTVFEQQFGVFANIDDPATEAAYERLEERLDAWEDELEAIGDNAFAATELADAQALWDRAVADWHAAAARFTCTQCGAPRPRAVPLPGGGVSAVPGMRLQRHLYPVVGHGGGPQRGRHHYVPSWRPATRHPRRAQPIMRKANNAR